MRKASIAILMVALFCLMLTGVVYAGAPGSTGTISGNVKGISTGSAISGATVTCGTVSATTDANGNYSMSVAAGSQTLSTTKTGYQQTWQICTVTAGATTTVNWSLTAAYPTNAPPAQTNGYVLLAWNDLGMHCDQDDYSYFCVLPPYNTLHLQIKDQNSKSGIIMSGVTVSYAFAKKTNSTLHTNFWTYSTSFGFLDPVTKQPLQPNEGIKGNYLSGNMYPDPNNKSFVVDGIPITPYDDDGTWDPYGQATITVKNSSTGAVINTVNVVAPVSTEMMCSNCHGTTGTFSNILSLHDSKNGTHLLSDAQAGKPDLCSSCHSDNAISEPGVAGVESLSLAMHKFHALNASVPAGDTGCYYCHPGPKTQCLRGIMSRAGKQCNDCHGDITNVYTSIQNGRNPWFQEPQCGQCHDSKHAENTNTLYRNSLLQNAPNSTMNNIIYCEACHNSTHAEMTTSNAADACVVQQVQGNNYWIYNCADCHPGKTLQNMHH